ncbi:MAG: hypothetical protein QOI34_231 [Verrucomicrobiota bacterium]|jgi:hypothetical protein
MKRRLWHIAAILSMVNCAQAALEFTLLPAIQSGALGTEVTYSGTLKNNSATETLFLNDIHFEISNEPIAVISNANIFFSNVPGILLPGETYTGPIFAVGINPTATPADYSGPVTIRGGSDIFALNNLQVQNVQVSSPSVTISATTPDADEFGPVPGVFTVSRTGSVNYDLSVNYAIAGTALNGGRFSSLTGSVLLPNGSASATITITPISNNVVEGDQTVDLSISSFGTYNVGVPGNGTVVIHDKPIDQWRLQHFGANANVPQIAGDAADPDGDGISNLMEYGIAADPSVASASDLPFPTVSNNHLQLHFGRNTSATDVFYVVEAGSDLVSGDWLPLVTRAPGSGWVANAQGATVQESGSGSEVSVTVTDPVPIIDPGTLQEIPRRFLRLRVHR